MIFFAFSFAFAKAGAGHPVASPSVVLWSAEMQINSAESPRADFEDKVVTNPAIKSCLRESLRRAGDDFSVTIHGTVSQDGVVSATRASTYLPPPVDSCLEKAFRTLDLKKGSATQFETTLERVRSPAPRGKSFKIDLNLKPQPGL